LREAIFETDIHNRPATFFGRVSFHGVKFHDQAIFHGAQFLGPVTFQQAVIIGGALFRARRSEPACVFSMNVDFSFTSVGGPIEFTGAIFKGLAFFHQANVKGGAQFGPDESGRLTHFLQLADFSSSTIAGHASFSSAIFKRTANFEDIRLLGGADFASARFESRALFSTARISGDVFFSCGPGNVPVVCNSKFSFVDVHVDGSADFAGAQFLEDARFARMHVQGDTHFGSADNGIRTSFLGRADFTATRLFGRTIFSAARFDGESDFTGSRFESNAYFVGARFGRTASFNATDGKQELHLAETTFVGHLSLKGANYRVIFFEPETNRHPSTHAPQRMPSNRKIKDQPSQQKREFDDSTLRQINGTVDLRGATFERISVEWKPLLDAQEPYDRQPYTEIEAAFSRMGEDSIARDVYYAQRKREMSLRWSQRSGRHRVHAILGWLHMRISGFGVRPFRFLGILALLIVVGTKVFTHDDATTIPSAATSAEGARNLDPLRALQVALDQILPSPVSIPGANGLVPSAATLWSIGSLDVHYSDFATLLSISGWILVPVGVVLLSRALMRDDR
jgi:uncharacterized protein YjbI with pentapeptide repeats